MTDGRARTLFAAQTWHGFRTATPAPSCHSYASRPIVNHPALALGVACVRILARVRDTAICIREPGFNVAGDRAQFNGFQRVSSKDIERVLYKKGGAARRLLRVVACDRRAHPR